MSRLTELDERSVVGMLARIRANHLDIKTTPQPTSVVSGVRTYQVPDGDGWDKFELVRNGSSSVVTEALLPSTGGTAMMMPLTITTAFEPENQESPVVYPYLQILLGNQEWEPRYHPSFGLIFSAKPNYQIGLISVQYLQDKTDYSADKLIYKYETSLNYGISNSSGERLRVRFRLRSTDRGKTNIKVVAYV